MSEAEGLSKRYGPTVAVDPTNTALASMPARRLAVGRSAVRRDA
ncbi:MULTISPECIES: hypothetical protein [Streptomyces]|nr:MULTISPECIES: hypothetical protein [Streptomyces]WCL89348.1 hypothetical protein PPN52_34810 [Streptomyces sp. JCM 35825]